MSLSRQPVAVVLTTKKEKTQKNQVQYPYLKFYNKH